MATLRDLQYMIEANTQGLNKAYPALDKLVASLDRLDKSVNRSAKSVDGTMKRTGASVASNAKAASKSADQIKAAMKRQEAAMVSAKAKVLDLNRAIQASGANSRLLANNTRAFNVLEKQLKRTDATTAELTLAKSKFNSALATSRRELISFNAAQRQTEATQKSSQAAMIRQTNTLERTRQRVLDLTASLRAAGEGNKVNELTTAFQQLEQSMSGGQLTAEQFSQAMNGFNGEMARIKRSTKFAEGVKGSFQEITKSAQIALGPLSGVASRMQNLSSLASTTSIAIAGTVGVFIALSVALAKSIIDGARWEKQFSRMNKILAVTGNSALISANQAELVVRKVSQSTSALQGEVREAAAGLLTISGMNEELLESSLKASQGLAIIGGGSIQTSFRNLAQVLQEPAQGLQTLTQYGVKFTAAERERILALEESGDRTAALAEIMRKLKPHIAAATGETKSLAGAWHEMSDSFLSFSQDFATGAGITGALTTWTQSFNRVLQMGSLAFNQTGKVMRGVTDLYETIQDSNDPDAALDSLRENLREIVRRTQEVAGTNLAPNVNLEDIQKAIDRVNAGDIQGATAALKDYVRETKNAAKTAKLHEIAVNQAMDMYSLLKQEFLSVVSESEHLENKLKGLDKNWALMVEGMVAAGKSTDEAHATLRRLRGEVELGTSSIKNYINQLEQSTINSQQEASITSAVGAEKRRLQIEQKILNDLWSSGIVTSSNYQAALEDLRKMGLGGLVKELEAATRAAEAASFAGSVAEMNKRLDEQIQLAKVARNVAVSSAREQAEALAIAAKMQEMLNAGIAQGTEEWDKQLSKVRELLDLEFQTELAKGQKTLEDQLRLSTITAEAAASSALEQAIAVAQAAKMQEMLNQGVAQGSEHWNRQLQLVRELANTDFTASHNEIMKDMQQQLAMQDAIVSSMFYSEGTRGRMVALAEKELELAAKYGSLLDERAQKELAVFKQLQARDTIVKDWEEIAAAVDKAFKGLEDSIVEFVKTGEFNFAKLASSILEDIFRITLRATILTPMQDWLGGLMGSLTGKGAPLGLDRVQAAGGLLDSVGTMANPAYVYVMNAGIGDGGVAGLLSGAGGTSTFAPSQGGFAEMLGLGGRGAGGGGIGSDAVAGGTGGPSTFGIGPVGQVTRAPLAPIAEASQAAAATVTKSFDAVDYASQRVAEAHANLGDVFSSFTDSTTVAADAITKNFGPGGGFEKVINLTQKEVTDLTKTLATEWVTKQGPDQGKAIIDTILNRKASGKWGDSITDVVNARAQFSDINSVLTDKLGRNTVDQLVVGKNLSAAQFAKADALVKEYLPQRAAGQPSIVGDHLNYLNPDPRLSGKNVLPGGWGGPEYQAFAKQNDLVFGQGQFKHMHGTAKWLQSSRPGEFGVNLPPGMQAAGTLPQGGWQPGMYTAGMPGMMQPGGSFTGSAIVGGGAMTPGLGMGMAGGGGFEGLAQSASQVSNSFTQLAEGVPQVTQGLSEAATQATELASGGLTQAQSGMQSLADNALVNAAQSQIQATASTTQMATQSTVAAASVQQLGAAAMTSAAQMQGGGVLGGIFHGGGVVGSGGGVAMMSGRGFATAPRLHGGLHPNEFRAILKRDEGVFTEEQMEKLGNAINARGEPEEDGRGGGRRFRGGGGIQVHLHGIKDYDSFRKSQAQLNAGISSAARQAEQRQN